MNRQPRLSDRHAGGIGRSGHGADGFPNESLRHELAGFSRRVIGRHEPLADFEF
jgi:hypothetical protein